MTWWNGETSLNEQMLKNLKKFSEKKDKYLQECLHELIKETKSEVLYQTTIGSTDFKIEFSPLEKSLPLFEIGTETRKHAYQINAADRKYLVDEVISHFNNKERYSNIECSSNSVRYTQKNYYLYIKIVKKIEEKIEKIEEKEKEDWCLGWTPKIRMTKSL